MNIFNFTDKTDESSSSSSDNPSTSDVSTSTSSQDDDMIAGQVESILREILIQRQSSSIENLQYDIDSGFHPEHKFGCTSPHDMSVSSKQTDNQGGEFTEDVRSCSHGSDKAEANPTVEMDSRAHLWH